MNEEQRRQYREAVGRAADWIKSHKSDVIESIGHLSEYLEYERQEVKNRIAQRKRDVLLAEKSFENYRKKVLMEEALDYASK